MCFSEIYIYVCLWENGGTKAFLSFSLELVKVGGYDFPHPRDGPRNKLFTATLCRH
jgi:hypothetical protein